MKKIACLLALLLILSLAPASLSAPPEGLVDLREIEANWIIDMRYATTNNFRGVVMYDTDDCYLRSGTAAKLAKAQAYLEKRGYALVILDAYRPQHVQQYMWDNSTAQERKYIADPKKGSNHTRGSAVDVTIAKQDGTLCVMQSAYDDTSSKAWRSYTAKASREARNNVTLLTKAMKQAGFKAIDLEWWHYSDSKSYELVKEIV